MSTKLSAIIGLTIAASVAGVWQHMPTRARAADMAWASTAGDASPLNSGQAKSRALPVEGMNEEVDLATEPRDRVPPAAARAYHPRYYEPEFMVVPRFRRPWHHQHHRDIDERGDR